MAYCAATRCGGGTGNGYCIASGKGGFYCACPDGEQLEDWAAGIGTRSCKACVGSGCTFNLQGGGYNTANGIPGTDKTAPEHRATQVLRYFNVGPTSRVSEINVEAMIEDQGAKKDLAYTGCPRIRDSVAVRHVDAHSGEITNCWDDDHPELVYNLQKICASNKDDRNMFASPPASEHSRRMSCGNPCENKIGGRIEMVARSPGVAYKLKVTNPKLGVKTEGVSKTECAKCQDAEWTQGMSGYEYQLEPLPQEIGQNRPFMEAERYCQSLGASNTT